MILLHLLLLLCLADLLRVRLFQAARRCRQKGGDPSHHPAGDPDQRQPLRVPTQLIGGRRSCRMMFLPFCFISVCFFFLTPASFPNSIPPAFFYCGLLCFFLSYQKTVCPRACRCWKPHFRATHVLRRFIFRVLAPPTLPALLRVGTSRRFLSQACMVRDSRREATSESSSFCPRRMWEDRTALTHSLTH